MTDREAIRQNPPDILLTNYKPRDANGLPMVVDLHALRAPHRELSDLVGRAVVEAQSVRAPDDVHAAAPEHDSVPVDALIRVPNQKQVVVRCTPIIWRIRPPHSCPVPRRARCTRTPRLDATLRGIYSYLTKAERSDMEWREYIHSDPSVLVGKPVVRGTRLSVDFLLDLAAAGWTEQQILENYPSLTREGLRAVFAYAAECMREERIHATPQ